MARSRRYGEDLTYAEWHRNLFPELYGRVGHRIDMADRDWTEYCHYCKTPLMLVEEVRDRGQDLLDKGVTATRRVAGEANIQAWLMAWRVRRPEEVDDEIERLHARIRDLESQYPIVGFRVLNLRRKPRRVLSLTPDEWMEHLAISHREHHIGCDKATEFTVPVHGMVAAKAANPLHQVDLFDILRLGGVA